MADIKGIYDEKFQKVREIFEYSLDHGDDIGASFAVFIEGEPVIDIWGGFFDGTFTREWDRDTITTTHSTTKTMTAMAALVAADRGLIDLNERVAKYWPEFAQNGKENVLVRHLLGHTSGLAGWTEDVTWEDVYDLKKSCDLLAKQAPWWEPGTASGYHGVTQGHLVSGVIERVTGKTLGQFFADEIAGPLGADYHIGLDPEDLHRAAPFIQAIPEAGLTGNKMLDRVAMNPNLNPVNSSTDAWRMAEVGAANGQGNARSVATIHSALVTDKVNGVSLLSPEGRRRVLEEQSNGIDLLIEIPIRWGMGFALESPLFAENYGHNIAYWGGNGGSLGYADLDEKMTISFVMNRWIEGMHEYGRYQRLVKAVYGCLGYSTNKNVFVVAAPQ